MLNRKLNLFVLLSLAVFISLQAQPPKKSKEEAKYRSRYEDKTLSPTDYPDPVAIQPVD